jgi:hypothetical protein
MARFFCRFRRAAADFLPFSHRKSAGCPGAGSLAAAAGAIKKARKKIVPSASRALCCA